MNFESVLRVFAEALGTPAREPRGAVWRLACRYGLQDALTVVLAPLDRQASAVMHLDINCARLSENRSTTIQSLPDALSALERVQQLKGGVPMKTEPGSRGHRSS